MLIALVGAYALFLLLTPVFAAIVSALGPAPKDRAKARASGETLLREAKTIVAVGAHPDDIEWYAGGTLAEAVQRGARVIVVMVTDGGRRGLAGRRHEEQLKAARVMGYERVIFLDYPDGSLAASPKQEVEAKLASAYREYQPDTLITFDPFDQGPLYRHPDHLAAGAAAVAAAGSAGLTHVFLFHSSKPDTWVDVSDTVGIKIEGRAAHRSQTKLFLTPFGTGPMIRETAFLEGRKADLAYAESFRKFR